MFTRLTAALGAAALLLTACGGADESSTPASTSAAGSVATTSAAGATPAPPAAPAPAAVPAELQFTAQTLDGADFDGASVLGTPTVFWFWTPWCPVCQREAAVVGQVADANPDVTFVGVAAQDEVSAMQEFVSERPVAGFDHLADSDGTVWTTFGVTQQPAFAFVHTDGSIDVVKGTLSEAELTERVTALAAG